MQFKDLQPGLTVELRDGRFVRLLEYGEYQGTKQWNVIYVEANNDGQRPKFAYVLGRDIVATAPPEVEVS